ncbi:c-type cytochrome [Pararhizobium sp.]|uniref:c-type cytochrome n=1 Tax=Pararhizobium sp. TaxID=1977563 RepID=UPI00272869E0|nr:cytochrome c family protein [Pararhizobium sp.]MDO9414862.1 cytochrome c family protein [Pararhizobium sp.]
MLVRRIAVALCLCLGAAGPGLADGDAGAGKAVFRKCAPCHTATEPVAKVGPSLMGIVGRPVATFPGYSYSEAMTAFGADGKVWDEALLSDYLLSPKAMVPGTRMTFAGLKKPQDIADIIAYLKDPAAVQ